jgi:hypothetical protein
VERLRKPPPLPPPDPAEELLREWPELETFGAEWVKRWLDLRDRLVEIAKVLRRFPWMVEVIKQRQMSILHPYMIEVYVARDGSVACLSLTPAEGFLRPKRLGEGDKAGAAVQLARGIRKQDKRGVQTQGITGIHHGDKGIREGALAP